MRKEGFEPHEQYQFVVRVVGEYKPERGWSSRLAFDPYSASDLVVQEYRPRQDLCYQQLVSKRFKLNQKVSD